MARTSQKKTKTSPKKSPSKTIKKDHILGITNPALKRVAHRAGAKNISAAVYEEARIILKCELEHLVKNIVLATDADKVKTIDTKHVRASAKSLGINILYGEHLKEDASLALYQQKILKQTHHDLGQKKETVDLVGNMALYVIDRIMQNANQLKKLKNIKTLTSKEIQTAVRMTLPGELAKHAVSEGTKAVSKSVQCQEGDKRQNRASKAGLTVSVSRVENLMRELSNYERLGAGAPVYLAATIEYLLAEIYELSGNCTRDNKKVRIKPRCVYLAVFNDEELGHLFKNTIMSAGVLPEIDRRLLKTKKAE